MMVRFDIDFSSLTSFSKFIRDLSKEEILYYTKFKHTLRAFQYNIEHDLNTIESLTITPYELFTNEDISVFGFYWYYTKYPEKLDKRYKKKKYLKAKVLMELLNPTIKEYIENV
jgi:hypothetical protein